MCEHARVKVQDRTEEKQKYSVCYPFMIYCKQLFSIHIIADLVWMTGCRRIFTHHDPGCDSESSSSALLLLST